MYVQLICEVEPVTKGRDKAIGIDVGVKRRAVLSDGTMLPKRVLKCDKVKRLQRAVSRAVKGSGTRKKKVRQLAKEWHRIRIRERNNLHRLTTALVRNHGKYIAVENIKTKNLTAKGGSHKKGMNRNILEQNWGTFTYQLSYKAASAGGKLGEGGPEEHDSSMQCMRRHAGCETHAC